MDNVNSVFRRILAFGLCAIAVGCGAGKLETLETQLRDPNVETRLAAARSLGEMKADAAPAVPALIEAMQDVDVEMRRLCCQALGEIGKSPIGDSVAALAKQLESTEWTVRLAAAFALQKIDPNSDLFVDEINKAMQRGEGGTIVAVGKMGPSAAWAVPALTELLHDRRPGIRRIAADSLGQIGVAAAASEPALRESLKDPDDRVRSAAKSALAAVTAAPTPQ